MVELYTTIRAHRTVMRQTNALQLHLKQQYEKKSYETSLSDMEFLLKAVRILPLIDLKSSIIDPSQRFSISRQSQKSNFLHGVRHLS